MLETLNYQQLNKLAMAFSSFTADTSLDITNGDNAILSGSISVSGNAVTG